MEQMKNLIQMRIDNASMVGSLKRLLEKNRPDKKASIRIKNTCYSDVILTINGKEYENTEKIENSMFKIKDGEVSQILF